MKPAPPVTRIDFVCTEKSWIEIFSTKTTKSGLIENQRRIVRRFVLTPAKHPQ
jgi:hypothetical protein